MHLGALLGSFAAPLGGPIQFPTKQIRSYIFKDGIVSYRGSFGPILEFILGYFGIVKLEPKCFNIWLFDTCFSMTLRPVLGSISGPTSGADAVSSKVQVKVQVKVQLLDLKSGLLLAGRDPVRLILL